MSLELMGNAAINYKSFWLDKFEIQKSLKLNMMKLIKNKINVQLYNFPLCYIDPSFWTFSRKSITDYKRKYSENCQFCLERFNCGGFFNSTFDILHPETYPILEEYC